MNFANKEGHIAKQKGKRPFLLLRRSPGECALGCLI